VKNWRIFFFLIGLSSMLGSVSHGVHEQLGNSFLSFFIFAMNAVSLIAVYYFFEAAFSLIYHDQKKGIRIFQVVAMTWVIVLLIITYFQNKFLLIKIHAGIVLLFSLITHIITTRKGLEGSVSIILGILVSFTSIIVHSLKFSFGEWFNYKDISHLIMLSSCILMYKGVVKLADQQANMSGDKALKA
jgi:hypothetical protein